MTAFILLLQKVNINEKIKNAPDEGYQIGVLIGLLTVCYIGFTSLLDLHSSQKQKRVTH